MTVLKLFGKILIIVLIISSCCKVDFNKNQALEDFNRLKPKAKLYNYKIYGCSGIECECTYAEFKYTLEDSTIIHDTTLQYWLSETIWTLNEH